MTNILLYIGAIAASCAQSAFTKQNTRRGDGSAESAGTFHLFKAVAVFAVLLLIFLFDRSWNAATIGWGAAYGVLLTVSMITGYYALKTGPMALTSMIVSFSLLIPYAYGIVFLGEKPKLIELSFYGIKLERKNDCVQNTEEIAVYASGPLANLVLSAVIFAAGGSEGIRMAALISLCVGAFNMLPCAPLDGGNILHFVLNRITDEEKSGKISFYISFAVLAPMTAAGIVLLLKNRNITLLAVSGYLVLAAWSAKKSALS